MGAIGGRTTKTATIANGAALSGEIDLEGARVITVHMPAAWTAADLGIKASPTSGGTFNPLYDDEGTLVSASVDADQVITFDRFALPLAGVRYIKLWSQNAGADENQGGARSLTVELRA